MCQLECIRFLGEEGGREAERKCRGEEGEKPKEGICTEGPVQERRDGGGVVMRKPRSPCRCQCPPRSCQPFRGAAGES